jgi:hypothetical protein
LPTGDWSYHVKKYGVKIRTPDCKITKLIKMTDLFGGNITLAQREAAQKHVPDIYDQDKERFRGCVTPSMIKQFIETRFDSYP